MALLAACERDSASTSVPGPVTTIQRPFAPQPQDDVAPLLAEADRLLAVEPRGTEAWEAGVPAARDLAVRLRALDFQQIARHEAIARDAGRTTALIDGLDQRAASLDAHLQAFESLASVASAVDAALQEASGREVSGDLAGLVESACGRLPRAVAVDLPADDPDVIALMERIRRDRMRCEELTESAATSAEADMAEIAARTDALLASGEMPEASALSNLSARLNVLRTAPGSDLEARRATLIRRVDQASIRLAKNRRMVVDFDELVARAGQLSDDEIRSRALTIRAACDPSDPWISGLAARMDAWRYVRIDSHALFHNDAPLQVSFGLNYVDKRRAGEDWNLAATFQTVTVVEPAAYGPRVVQDDCPERLRKKMEKNPQWFRDTVSSSRRIFDESIVSQIAP